MRFAVWMFVFAFALWDAGPVTRNPVLREVLFWVGLVLPLVGVPVLLILAWTGWIGGVRPGMPAWRNGLGLTALVLTSLHWGYAVLLLAVALADLALRTLPSLIDQDAMYALLLMKIADLIAIVLAMALKRAPRIQAIVAGILMFAFGPAGYS
jgi:hypothetical protein